MPYESSVSWIVLVPRLPRREYPASFYAALQRVPHRSKNLAMKSMAITLKHTVIIPSTKKIHGQSVEIPRGRQMDLPL